MKHFFPIVLVCFSLFGQAQDQTTVPPDAAKFLGRDFYFQPGVGLILSPTAEGAAVASQARRYGTLETTTLLGSRATESTVPYGDPYLQESATWRLGIRTQKTFQDIAGATDPAELQWSETDGEEDYQIDGAVLFDLYFAKDSLFGYDPKHRSVRLTFGAEAHKFTDGDLSVDTQTFFALVNLTPAFARRKKHGSEKEKWWRQPLQIGGQYTVDNLTNDERWGLVFNYQPVIGVIGKWYGFQDRLQGFGLNTKALYTF